MNMNIERQWAVVSVIAGVMAVVTYALFSIISGPFRLGVILVCAFGPLLATASIGLYHVLAEAGNSVMLQLAVIFNVLGATIFTMMGLVQLSVHYQFETLSQSSDLSSALIVTVDAVQLGLDVAWDVFISVGTLLFALSMFKDVRFGRIIGSLGVLIAVALLVLNVLTFPVPPANSNLIDLGPLLGLWYLVVTIFIGKQLFARKGVP
jgi:hypothetical protein